MRIIRKTRKRVGSIVLEASIAMPFIILLLAAVLTSMTAVNAELYVQRATENVITELNVAIPFATQGISCMDDISKSFGLGDLIDVDMSSVDSALGVIGSVSGATGVDLEDVLGTAVFGRYVRDRILLEYRNICKENWVVTDPLKEMSVYLDYSGNDKCIYVDVFFHLGAGKIDLSRSYSTSVSMYADEIKLGSSEKAKEKESDSIWEKDNFTRGNTLREQFGGNLPYNFPVVSKFENNEATVIKSIDTTSPYYQNEKILEKTVKKSIDELSSFEGAQWGKTVISSQDIHSKKVLFVIPKNGDASCKDLIRDMSDYAMIRGISLQIEEYGESHRYEERKEEE